MRNWKTWMMVVALIAIAAAAIVFVILGISTHHEPVFLDDAIAWERDDFPLTVCAADDVSESLGAADSRALDYSIETINTRLGFDALARSERVCAVTVTFGVPREAGRMETGGDASWAAGERTCRVRVSNAFGELLSLVVQHELGHCLGLAHDEDATSIMRAVQSPTPMGQFPPHISDTDRAVLRERFAR